MHRKLETMRRALHLAMMLSASGAIACADEHRDPDCIPIGDFKPTRRLTSICPQFVRLVAGDFERDGSQLVLTLEVEDIPDTFTLNGMDVPLMQEEYSWEIQLDPDDDGSSELRVSLSYFKFRDEPLEIPRSDLVNHLQMDIWRRDGLAADSIGYVDVTLREHTFEFRPRDVPQLAHITKRSQLRWVASYNVGIGNCVDVLE